MEESIVRVIEKDLEAQEALGSANTSEETLTDLLEKKKEVIKNELWSETEKYVQEQKEVLEKSLNENHDLSKEQFDASLQALENSFSSQKEKWNKEILERVISLEVE